HETLSDFSYTKNLIGWIRGDNSIDTNLLAEEIARLTKENADLRQQLLMNNSGKDLLYNNLNFNQLKKLLESETVIVKMKRYNLFEFLIYHGKKIIENVPTTDGEIIIALIALRKFKIVVSVTGVFSFTDDGHNFYLQSLLFEKERLES
ncbi:hypothetical protein, partial [Flavobacterium sp.]|uniref:hypothetical protein n=1 Tax=Flavobacterium sp. TaxID=239 RepID=UPI0026049259